MIVLNRKKIAADNLSAAIFLMNVICWIFWILSFPFNFGAKIRLAIIIKVYAVTGILFSIAHMIYQSDIAIWKCDTMYPLHLSGTNFSNSARLSFEEYPHSTELRASIAI